ncbi:MFS transporter [Amorphoplanes nipponensis]|uniref:MFS-type transporter YdeG n=1 Tax=Actinoplanes nipponensis TaxID=135950 RepID=A0A919MM42_9ACTN|nr:MFS transporter [Actinoplanes nipponensis]GIE47028.1 putative MFS-type transporter YdeG [Actinoplanes nipponensis]
MAATTSLDPPAARAALQRRTLRVVMTSQVFSGAGLAAGVTVGTLLAADMLGTSSLSGLPVALFTAGSAGAALLVGRLSQRLGRRAGLTTGYAAGAIGGAGVVLAAAVDSVALLMLFLLVYGAGTATNLQARYAGADLAVPQHRGRAVSSVLVATTLGAVAGPNLVAITGGAARHVGIPALAGPFGLAAIAYALAGATLFALLRPDPLQTSLRITAAQPPDTAVAGGQRTVAGAASAGGVMAGATTMVLTQLVMVAVMAMTPIHMRAHGHDLQATGLVIAVHIAGMYLPSPLTGLLVDRLGRIPVAVASGLTLLAAGVVAASAPTASVAALALALGLLGLGWNLGLISGTAMVTDALPPDTRARTQGAVDLCVALAGAGGGIASGLILTVTNYATLALGGGILALAVIPFLVRRRPASTLADRQAPPT